MPLSEVHILLGQKRLLPFEKISKHYLTIFFFCPIREREKTFHFLIKSWVFFFGKYANMRLSEVHIFIGQKRFFSIEKIPKHYFKIIFTQKQEMKIVLFSDQNYGLIHILKCIFLQPRNDSFLSKRSSNIIFKIIFAQKQKKKKMLV